MKARVYLSTSASLVVTVDVPDGLAEEEAREIAIAAAYEATPGGICAQCSGWNQSWGLDLGEWEVDDAPDAVELAPATPATPAHPNPHSVERGPSAADG